MTEEELEQLIEQKKAQGQSFEYERTENEFTMDFFRKIAVLKQINETTNRN